MRVMVSASALLAPIVGITLLLGCSTGAQIESNRMMTAAAKTNAAANTCYQTVVGKPDYLPLKTKMHFGPDNAPLQFLTNTSVPTKQEIALLYVFHADVQTCRKISLDGTAKVHPLLMLTLVESFSARDKVWAEVVSGRLTWGQFNQGLKDVFTQSQANTLAREAR